MNEDSREEEAAQCDNVVDIFKTHIVDIFKTHIKLYIYRKLLQVFISIVIEKSHLCRNCSICNCTSQYISIKIR